MKDFYEKLDVETGEIYNSQRDAGRAVGIHPYGITCVLMGRQKTAGGYHWERTDEKQDYYIPAKNLTFLKFYGIITMYNHISICLLYFPF